MAYEVFALIIIVIVVLLIIAGVALVILLQKGQNVGDPCNSNSDCTGGSICDHTTKTCKLPNGDSCSVSSDCITGSTCTNGACTSKPKNDPSPEQPTMTFPQIGDVYGLPPVNGNPACSGYGPFGTCTSSIAADGQQDPAPVTTAPVSRPPLMGVNVKDVTQDIGYGLGFNINSMDSDFSESYPPYGSQRSGYSARSGSENSRWSCSNYDSALEDTVVNVVDGNVINSNGTQVIDVMKFSSSTLYLLKSGNIIKEGNDGKIVVRSNITATALDRHMGYLYAVASGNLYILNMSTFSGMLWHWKKVEWAPENIVYMSSTLDGHYLWLQTEMTGWLYDKNHNLVETVEVNGMMRKYGNDNDQYVDIDTMNCMAVVTSDGEKNTFASVCDAVITNDGKLVSISQKEIGKYAKIRLVNYVPFYIRTHDIMQI